MPLYFVYTMVQKIIKFLTRSRKTVGWPWWWRMAGFQFNFTINFMRGNPEGNVSETQSLNSPKTSSNVVDKRCPFRWTVLMLKWTRALPNQLIQKTIASTAEIVDGSFSRDETKWSCFHHCIWRRIRKTFSISPEWIVLHRNHMVLEVIVRVIVMKPILSKINAELRKFVNDHKDLCEVSLPWGVRDAGCLLTLKTCNLAWQLVWQVLVVTDRSIFFCLINLPCYPSTW